MTARRPGAGAIRLAICVLALLSLHGSPVEAAEDAQKTPDALAALPQPPSTAEITFPRPTAHALIQHGRDGAHLLLVVGDVLVNPQDEADTYTALQIDQAGVLLQENRTGTHFRWKPGQVLPAIRELRLLRTIQITTLRYEYEPVEHLTQPGLIITGQSDSIVKVKKQTLHRTLQYRPEQAHGSQSPSPDRFVRANPTMARLLDVTAVDTNTYDLASPGLKPALANLGQVLHDLSVMVSPALSMPHGLGFSVSSDLADGTLNSGGFTVTNSKAAQLFGISVGDTILRINDRAVNGPLSAWWTYQEFLATNNPSSEVRVALRRNGAIVTKTYLVK